MGIDASIALQGRPVQLDNPLDVRARALQLEGAERQNALGRYGLQKAQREDEEQNAIADAYRRATRQDGTVDRGALLNALSGGAGAGRIPGVQKQLGEQDKQQADIDKVKAETAIKNIGMARDSLVAVNDPQTYQTWRGRLLQTAPDFGQMLPEQFTPQVKVQLLQTADQMIERLLPKLVMTDTGGQIVPTNPYTGAAGGNAFAKSATPGDILTDTRVKSEGAANRAVTVRGQDMGDARARDEAAARAAKEKAPTEGQAKAALFLGEMRDAQRTIDALEKDIDASSWVRQTDIANATRGAGGGLMAPLSNMAATPKGQKYSQAASRWAEAFLRVKTGAAATKEEVDRNVATFFPVPGDSAETVRQKAEARAAATREMEIPAGPAARSLPAEPNRAAGKVKGVLTANPDGSYNYGTPR